MRAFILAFPLPYDEASAKTFLETVHIKSVNGPLVIPGCALSLEAFLKPPVLEIAAIFSENAPITLEESKSLSLHKSIFFIKGSLTNKDSLLEINKVISSLLNAGALGVYFENSGAAWTASTFKETSFEEFPMEPWLNYIETTNDIFTLGMESFGLPDICVSKLIGTIDSVKDLLSFTADALFIENFKADTGAIIEVSEDERFCMLKESRTPFKKTDFEYNKQGAWRLVRKQHT